MKKYLLLVCFTFAQLQDSNCKLYCRLNGYDSGLYVEATNKCWCANAIPDDLLLEKRLSLPKKKLKGSSSVPTIPYINSNDEIKLHWESS